MRYQRELIKVWANDKEGLFRGEIPRLQYFFGRLRLKLLLMIYPKKNSF